MVSNAEETSDWACLPTELLYLILEKLKPLSDHIRFSSVCRNWQVCAQENYVHKKRIDNDYDHGQLPMLLMVDDADDSRRTLYSLTNSKMCDHRLHVEYRRRFCGSSHGWLIFLDKEHNSELVIMNPFLDGPTFRLPPVKESEKLIVQGSEDYTYEYQYESEELVESEDEEDDDYDGVVYFDWTYNIVKCVLSGDPSLNPDDYMAMVIYGDMGRMAYIKSGDKDWTYLDSNLFSYDDIIIYNGEFHALQHWGEVLSCGILKMSDNRDHEPNIEIVAPECPKKSGVCKTYIVELGGDLIQVRRKMNGSSFFTMRFDIFKLQENAWIEMKNLGDYALFLGDNYSTSVLASDFPGCSPNSIYYTHDYFAIFPPYRMTRGYLDMGIYNIEKKSFGLHSTNIKASEDFMPPPIWIVPTFKRATC